jgi:hypothetical protein
MKASIWRVLLVTAGLVLQSATAHAEQRFSILQDLPVITHIDMGDAGHSHGDIMAFEAPFSLEDGTKGTMNGIIMTVDIPLPNSGDFYDRIAQIMINFGHADSLVVAGSAVYESGDTEMRANHMQHRAVVGGTGRFIGARGEMITVRRDAGHYEHHITLID